MSKMAADRKNTEQLLETCRDRHLGISLQSNKTGHVQWILLLAVMSACCQVSESTGHIEVYFVRYTDRCKEDFIRNKCDPYFKFCLSRPQDPPKLSRADCHYAFSGSSNGYYSNTDDIDFSTKTSILGHANPWIVRVEKFIDPKIQLTVNVRDHDRFSSNDHLHTWGIEMQTTVWRNKEISKWTQKTSKSSDHSIQFKFRLYCDPHYYTSSCGVYCKPQDAHDGHYTCDSDTGQKICMEGWTGKQCTEDIDECSLRQDVCSPGQCVNLPGNFTCECPPGYTGSYCKTKLDPCESSPCHNGGSCHAVWTDLSYICECPRLREGKNCEEKRDPCRHQPCLNGGSCVSTPRGSFRCNCPNPYRGVHCEKVLTTTTTTTTTTTPTTTTSTTTTPTTTTTTTTPTTTTTTIPTTTPEKTTPTTTLTSTTTTTPEKTTSTTKAAITPILEPVLATAAPVKPDETPLRPQRPQQPRKTTVRPEVDNPDRDGMRDAGGHGYLKSSKRPNNHPLSGIQVWHLGLVSGILLLMMLAGVIYFVMKRRKHKHEITRSTSVSYDGDNVGFEGEEGGAPDALNNGGGVQSPQMADISRELPPVPLCGSDYTKRDYTVQVCGGDEEGAVGGCKPSEKCKLDKTDVKETAPQRSKRGRAEANDYSDFTSLHTDRTLPSMVVSDGYEIDEDFNPYEEIGPHGRKGATEDNTSLSDIYFQNADLEDPQYNTLSEMEEDVSSHRDTQPLADNKITRKKDLTPASVHNDLYCNPRPPVPAIAFENPLHSALSVPTYNDTAGSANTSHYSEPTEDDKESNKHENPYASPTNLDPTDLHLGTEAPVHDDHYTFPRVDSVKRFPKMALKSTPVEAASNPMYDSLPSSSQISAEELVAPIRLPRDDPVSSVA